MPTPALKDRAKLIASLRDDGGGAVGGLSRRAPTVSQRHTALRAAEPRDDASSISSHLLCDDGSYGPRELMHAEHSVKVVDRCPIHLQPRPVSQEPVDFIRNDHFLKRHAGFLQPPYQIDHLVKLDITVVVTLDQQHRRLP